ncbi:MAG: GNAT family N-acetyltransferase [Bacteroidota bacterium]
MEKDIHIRLAQAADQDAIWQIIQAIIAKGDTYVFAPDSSREKMLNFWAGANTHCYVAESDNKIVGTFMIKPNFPDQGSHVANAGYMTAPEHFGKGIGRRMAEFSLEEARRLGFQAMQFNIVVKTNERALRLWQKLGFVIMGEIPEAFQHPEKGLVPIYVMWKKL